jgi:hypothetical protein
MTTGMNHGAPTSATSTSGASAARSTGGSGGTAPATPEELREEIAQTRADLGETAAALAAKADVKGRVTSAAKEKAEAVRQRATAEAVVTQEQLKQGDVAGIARRPVPMVAVAALAAAVVGVVLLIRRARR